MTVDALIDDFAIRSFRDQADQDYISARMACRAHLVTPYLWESQQALEKYLKCILLLNRIPATHVKHDLQAAITVINTSQKLTFELSPPTKHFIDHVNAIGQYRYLEVSRVAFSRHLVALDRAVWELRRHCCDSDYSQIRLREGELPPKIRIAGGYLEKVIETKKRTTEEALLWRHAREALLWHNAFFGSRNRKKVRMQGWIEMTSAPLDSHPEILDELLRYVYLPKAVIRAYRSRTEETTSV